MKEAISAMSILLLICFFAVFGLVAFYDYLSNSRRAEFLSDCTRYATLTWCVLQWENAR